MRYQPKPAWIKVRPPAGPTYLKLVREVKDRGLHTVCEEARCPNVAECWGSGTATLMLMGELCTRGCRFCSVPHGTPSLPPDPCEPEQAAKTVQVMNLSYVVLTSVDRDDLADGGAAHFAQTISTIRKVCPETLIEALIPDFSGQRDALATLVNAAPEVLGHNLETVSRLTPTVRDRRASYDQSLGVLSTIKELNPHQLTKSSLMLGLGEGEDEVREALSDLQKVGVDFLTLGQYLQPSPRQLPVSEFITPERFKQWEEEGLDFGFRYVASGPLVRSSYKAGEHFVSTLLRPERSEATLTP